jgi:hypothetical protein
MLNKQRVATRTVDTLREAAWAPLTVLGLYALGLTFGLFQLSCRWISLFYRRRP